MMRRRNLLQGSAAFIGAAALVGQPLAQQREDRFALGVASGSPRPDGMVLWTRLVGDGLAHTVEVAWEVARDEAFSRIAARGVETARADDAHSVHAEPAGLEPGRWYWYRFRALGQQSAAGRTRTAPAADAAEATLRFVTASCQRWDHGHYAAWRDAVAHEPDLIVFLGDYIYEYGAIPGRVRTHTGRALATLADYRARHAQYKTDPALQAAHAAAPWLLAWDDHEVENDYAGLQSQTLQSDFAAQRAAAYQAYWEHLPLPMSARPKSGSMVMASRTDWGRLARIHLLDTRQHRDPQACPRPNRGGSNTVALSSCGALRDPARSLLGREQERWLSQGWDLDRPWNLLAQSTLMARFAWSPTAGDPRYWTDGWDGYPASRARLLGEVHERRVPGVVVLGGDVHAHYVADLKPDFDDEKSPVVASEFCGTSISSHSTARGEIGVALAHNPHIHHGRSDKRGIVRFELDARELRADLRAVDDPDNPASVSASLARFTVDARQPGPQRTSSR
jgi:alkaline phosphatase D